MKETNDYICEQCGKTFYARRKVTRNIKVFCSQECGAIFYSKVKNKPTKMELEKMLSNHVSYVTIGRMYGVSDNAVKKWMKKFGIHKPKHHPSVKFTCAQCGWEGEKEYNQTLNKRGEAKKMMFCDQDCFDGYRSTISLKNP
jgi:ribosomal protein L33